MYGHIAGSYPSRQLVSISAEVIQEPLDRQHTIMTVLSYNASSEDTRLVQQQHDNYFNPNLPNSPTEGR
jgi:hypothetical protein